MSARSSPWKRLVAVGGLAAAAGAAGLGLHAGAILCEPAHRAVGAPPPDPPCEAVEFASGTGRRVRGWFARGRAGAGAVLLLHSLRADRRSMVERARFLHAQGLAVLLIDLQAHGESGGDAITFGHLESRDAAAAVTFLRDRLPGEPVAAIGVSLGGAACLLGGEPLAVEALVLESVYGDIETAIENRLRLRFGRPGAWLAPLLTLQIEPRLGVAAERLRPAEAITAIRAPVLVLNGEADRRTTVEDARRLFDAARGRKELWLVPGAGHEDLHAHSPAEYERRVLGFLRSRLGTGGD